MASLSHVCFVPAKGLIRDLSANSSNVAFEVLLASKWWWQSGPISHKDSQLRNMPLTNLKKVQEFDNKQLWLALHTYVSFVPAKGLIRDLSANSSNIAFEVPLASKWWWQSGLISHKDSQLRNMSFKNLKKVQEFDNKQLWLASCLRNWESLCDIRPDCHHHFDASGTLNAMFD